MIRFLLGVAIALSSVVGASASPAHAQDGLVSLKSCNKGTVPVEVVVAWSDVGWQVEGQTIAPGDCMPLFIGTISEGVIGFGARDGQGRWVSLKATSVPDLGTHEYNIVQAMVNGGQLKVNVLTRDSHTLCVGPKETTGRTMSQPFQSASECAARSLVPLTASFRFVPTSGRCFDAPSPGASASCVGSEYALSFAANPSTGEIVVAAGADAAVTGSAGATTSASRPSAGTVQVGRLLSGKEVRKVGTTWQWADGTALELGGYLDAKTGLPPLSPKPQPAARAASAGSVKKIVDALGRFSACRDDVSAVFTAERFELDDRGVARVSLSRNGQPKTMAMPVGRMDLSATPQLFGDCWQLSVHCRDGAWCGENGTPPDGSTSSGLVFYTSTQEQMHAIMDALGEIAPNFRDTTPDIRLSP